MLFRVGPQRDRRPAARASRMVTGAGNSTARWPGELAPSAISTSPSRTRTEPSPSHSAAMGLASGGGRRSVISAWPSRWAAIRPHA
jgi:hypothetical protein